MNLHFNFFNVLILAGCVQGVILGVLLLFMKKRLPNHFFLSILLLTYSLNNLNVVFFDTGLSLQIPALLICPFSLIFAIGPALFLHTKFALRPDSEWKNSYYLHFLPVLLEFAWYAGLSVFFWNKPQAILQFYHVYENWYSLPEQLLGVISVLTYLLLTYQLLAGHRQEIKANFSAIADLTYQRLRMLILFLAVGWLGWVILLTADIIFFDFTVAPYLYYPLYIVMSTTIYAIGYSGYFRKVILIEYTPQPQQGTPLNNDPELKKIAGRLVQVMESKKLYLDPYLRLKTVADELHCSPQKLSAALNNVLAVKFYDFVNDYRVSEIKIKLADPKENRYTITGLAFSCGFNSKSTFNELFKKNTGQTPKEYKQLAQNDVRMLHSDVF